MGPWPWHWGKSPAWLCHFHLGHFHLWRVRQAAGPAAAGNDVACPLVHAARGVPLLSHPWCLFDTKVRRSLQPRPVCQGR